MPIENHPPGEADQLKYNGSMKIAIDGYEANVPQRLGSSQVAFELLKALERLDKKNEYIVLLPDVALPDLPKERTNWKYKILTPKRFWTKIALPFYLYSKRKEFDLIFSPTHYIPRFSPIKRIVTIFDLAFLKFPEMFTRKDLWHLTTGTRFSVDHADYIITISHFSKKDIMEQFKIKKDKITVAHPGYDKDTFKPINNKRAVQKILTKYGLEGNYIIYVGTIQPRKNLVRLFEAVSRIENINLVVVGKTTGEGRQGWMFDEIIKKPKELGIEDRVIFTGYVPTESLAYLLNGAKAYILPSLWEGFGIPVVEAMACGIPVIVSNVSSLPEVVGSAGILVDPMSLDQIEQAIRLLVSDSKLRNKKSKECLNQAKKFSWEKMTKSVLKVFDSVVQT